jgi:hypothetical protein
MEKENMSRLPGQLKNETTTGRKETSANKSLSLLPQLAISLQEWC